MGLKVQINIPCFKNIETLAFVLRSIQAQTYRNIRVSVYDNSSLSHGSEVIKAIESLQDHRFEYRSNVCDIGSYANYIQCLRDVNDSDYVVALAADIALHSKYIEILIQEATKHNAGAVYPRVKTVLAKNTDLLRDCVDDLIENIGKRVETLYEHDIAISGTKAMFDLVMNSDDGVYNAFCFSGSLINSRIATIVSGIICRNDMFHGSEYYIDLLLFANCIRISLKSDFLLCAIVGNERFGDTSRKGSRTLTRLGPISAMYYVIGSYRLLLSARGIDIKSMYKKICKYAIKYVQKGCEDKGYAIAIAFKSISHVFLITIGDYIKSNSDWK